jgi:peptidoglycan/xylan/chitin deacetylase (PgdA/CDA1 family)
MTPTSEPSAGPPAMNASRVPSPPAMRKSLRERLKAVLTGVNAKRLRGSPDRRAVVLCYHSIHPDKSFASATPQLFAGHLDWLVRHCRVVPLQDIASVGSALVTDERPAVAITFDDGYLDNYEYAFPLLCERGLTSTFFVTAGLLEKDAEVLGRLARLRAGDADAIRPMEWDHARAMQAGHMEIGAHTYSHPNLARLVRAAAREELARSKTIIEQRLGQPVRSVAYPFGKPRRHFTAETVSLVEELGYQYACQVLFRGVRASDSRFRIPRFFVRGDSIRDLRAKITGAWDPVGVWQEKSPVWLARRVSPRDFME